MTFEQAEKLRLDVYTMPLRMRPNFVETMTAVGRECTEFEQIVAGFTLFAVAVGPRNLEIERQRDREVPVKAPREVIHELQQDPQWESFETVQARIREGQNV